MIKPEYEGGQIMWLLFGITAIITATLNVVWTLRHRDAKWFRFVSLSFTSFTLCAFLSEANGWVLINDWSALMDVLPSTSKATWILTFASVVINSISLFKKNETNSNLSK